MEIHSAVNISLSANQAQTRKEQTQKRLTTSYSCSQTLYLLQVNHQQAMNILLIYKENNINRMEGQQIEIRVNDEKKIAEIWLAKSERDSTGFRSSLKPIYEAFSAKNYTPVVYMSGDNTLYDATEALLLHNRMQSAKNEVRREKLR